MKWNIEGVVINKKLFPCSTPTEVEKSATSSGADNIVTFTTNERKPLTSLDITIVPSQEGTGDPSPSNLRPLISYDKVTAKLQKGTTKVKEVVSFGSTVYGLTGDCVTGEFEETHGVVDLGSLTYTRLNTGVSSSYRFRTELSAKNADANTGLALCDKMKVLPAGKTYDADADGFTIANGYLYIYMDAYKTDTYTQFKEHMSGFSLCYELATPTELTTDPVEITTFVGEQTIKFDEKIPFTMKYLTLEGDSCDIAKQFLPLIYNKERRSL